MKLYFTFGIQSRMLLWSNGPGNKDTSLREEFIVYFIIFNTWRVKSVGLSLQTSLVMKWWAGTRGSPGPLMKGKKRLRHRWQAEKKNEKTASLSRPCYVRRSTVVVKEAGGQGLADHTPLASAWTTEHRSNWRERRCDPTPHFEPGEEVLLINHTFRVKFNL